jgi:hypothetical protein
LNRRTRSDRTSSDGDEGAEDQGEDAGEGGAGDPLYDNDLGFLSFDFPTDGSHLGIDVVEPALVVDYRLAAACALSSGAPAARNAS